MNIPDLHPSKGAPVRPRWVRRVARWCVLVLGAMLVSVTLLWALQERLVFPASRVVDQHPSDLGLSFDQVEIPTSDGERLAAWWIPARGSVPERGVVLYCHGNGGNVANVMALLPELQRRGLSVLAFDYRGYGESTGRPSEAGTYLDVAAAYEHLVGDLGVDPARIILWGRSLGGAIILHQAVQLSRRPAHERPAGLVLESTFTALPDVAAHHYPILPVRWLLRPRYPSLEIIGDLALPVIIAHAEEDEVIPYRQGRALFEAAPEPRRFVKVAGGHNVSSLARSRDGAALDEFLDEVLPPAP